ncbi:hypothetical protein LguiA_015951 [Lonicera macranthoides]
MGNCIAVQEKVMKTNGDILEYRAPIKVQQLLSDHAGHAVSDQIPAVCHLRPDSNMVSGHLYHLLPSPEFDQKKVEGEKQGGSGAVRIKILIRKQELEVMLTKGEVLSVDDLVSISQLQQKKQSDDDNNNNNSFDGNCRGGWRPVLASIPEVN